MCGKRFDVGTVVLGFIFAVMLSIAPEALSRDLSDTELEKLSGGTTGWGLVGTCASRTTGGCANSVNCGCTGFGTPVPACDGPCFDERCDTATITNCKGAGNKNCPTTGWAAICTSGVRVPITPATPLPAGTCGGIYMGCN